MTNTAETRRSAPPALCGICLDCHYPLRSLPKPRCPECGRPFDPVDPRTMNMGRPMSRRLRRLVLRPVGLWLSCAGAIATAAVVSGLQVPRGPWGHYEVGLVLWLAIGLAWLTAATIRRLVAHAYAQPDTWSRKEERRKRLIQWLFVVSVVALFTGAPAYLRFILFFPSIDRVAKAHWASPPPATVRTAPAGHLCPHGVWFPARVWDDRVPFVPAGFMYAPTGGPCRNGGRSGERFGLWGDWYILF